MNNELKIAKNLLELLSSAQAWCYQVVPHSLSSGILTFFAKERDENNLEELQLFFDEKIEFEIIAPDKLKQLLIQNYPVQKQGGTKAIEFSSDFNDFLPKIMNEAKMVNSSDIHVERYDAFCRIRFRIDGKLVERYRFDKERYPALVNRIKIQANLDIAEKRLP